MTLTDILNNADQEWSTDPNTSFSLRCLAVAFAHLSEIAKSGVSIEIDDVDLHAFIAASSDRHKRASAK